MKFRKKDFEKHNIDEFIDLAGSHIEGHKNYNYDSEIETGPLSPPESDDSTYEKGMSTTTDKFSKYVNPMNWWAMLYSFGGTPYSHGSSHTIVAETMELSEAAKVEMKRKIEELLKNRSEERGLVSKTEDGEMQEPLDAATEAKMRDFANAIQTKSQSQRKRIIGGLINLIKNG